MPSKKFVTYQVKGTWRTGNTFYHFDPFDHLAEAKAEVNRLRAFGSIAKVEIQKITKIVTTVQTIHMSAKTFHTSTR